MGITDLVGQRSRTAGVVNVRALVSFLASHEGGRTTDICLTYRPINNFGGPDDRESWFGQICPAPTDKISPGESREVVIQFNAAPALLAELTPGRTWRIQEGAQLVATATVLEILGET
jgi:translation elongation factor EF-Tu-like GTPase